MNRLIYISLFFSAILFSSFKPKEVKPEVKWYEWNEGYELAKKEHKMIFVHVYSSWCPFCKKMEKEAFEDKLVITTLNYNCINIRFNPEKGEKYKMDNYMLDGEQLLMLIGQNKVMGYPSQVFIFPNEGLQKEITIESGYKNPKEMMSTLDLLLTKEKRLEEKKTSLNSAPSPESASK
jgi:uncharacterized protein YyaL (SSP411 family)